MKIALGQINPTVGDLKGNIVKIKNFMAEAKKEQADIIAFPELSTTGYPPQDLLLNTRFVTENRDALSEIIEETEGILAIIGFVDYDDKRHSYNAAAVIKDKHLVKVIHKTLLPTYDVFDEDRYFEANEEAAIHPIPIDHKGFHFNLGVEICEDIWDEQYKIKVTDLLAERGSNFIINISASPFFAGKRLIRLNLLKEKALKTRTPLFYVNLVGGQDELVFDGQSFAVDSSGNLIAFAKQFEEDLVYVNLQIKSGTAKLVPIPPYNPEEEIFKALVLGIRDYFRKTGFERAVIGMSGGIDSSLTTCLAVEALGKDHVLGVSMPSRYSSDHSKSDAQLLAQNLGIYFIQIPIQKIVDTYASELQAPLEKIRAFSKINKSDDDPIADENIQPRIRGNTLMDISNRLKSLKILVLNTGNKTEMALGYCTLYGDMSGGIGAIGDVSKIEVYKLASYYNKSKGRDIIPKTVFTKKPSPELKENQFDPFDFDIISPLVDEIIENRRPLQELIDMGYPQDVVKDTMKKIKHAEYKRWQAPPCIKITRKAFGIGWKMPIVNRYDENH